MGRRIRLVHFVSVETGEPLCDGPGSEAAEHAVNGVAVCAECARLLTSDLDRQPQTRPRVLESK